MEAPTAGSVILAGILLKLGTYGFLRFSIPLFPYASILFTPLIETLSILAIIYSCTSLRMNYACMPPAEPYPRSTFLSFTLQVRSEFYRLPDATSMRRCAYHVVQGVHVALQLGWGRVLLLSALLEHVAHAHCVRIAVVQDAGRHLAVTAPASGLLLSHIYFFFLVPTIESNVMQGCTLEETGQLEQVLTW